MNPKIAIQLGVIVVLLGGAAWLLRDKVSLFMPRTVEQSSNVAAPQPTPDLRFDAEGNPVSLKPPAFTQPDPAHIAPLPRNTRELTVAPSPPSNRAPVVVLAPWHGPNLASTPKANLLEAMTRTYIRATPKNRLLINLVSSNAMKQLFYREDLKYSVKGHPKEDYLQNARALGADIFIFPTVHETATRVPKVELTLLDLRKDRTVEWSSDSVPVAAGSIAALLTEIAKTCVSFCGVNENDMTAAGMFTGLPSDQTWDTLLAATEHDELLFSSVLEQDPDCVYVYEYATSRREPTRYIDRGLKKWPDDIRLLRQKARVLEGTKNYNAAWLIRSELMRRYPDCLLIMGEASDFVEFVFTQPSDATDAPAGYLATIQLLRQQTTRFPDNWLVHWEYCYAVKNLAWYIRGNRTADMVPVATWKKREEYLDQAVWAVRRAVELQPRSTRLLTEAIRTHFAAGHTDPQWQREVIAMIHQIDPTNVEAELAAASSHSVGWGSTDDYWSFIQQAVKNHGTDARAMHEIAKSLNNELARMLSWKRMTEEEVYAKPNPLSDQFIECAEYAMNHGVQVEKWVAGMLRAMYHQRYGEAKVSELVESGKHWALTGEAAQRAHDAGDWEKSLRLARVAEPKARPYMTSGRLQYYVVKSLWKLGRHEEALSEARAGIGRYPDEQTFYYMFAVVANEKGAPLEEAYQRAYRAIDILTTNTGANETFESLRRKLNKPPHPKLKS